MKDWSWEENKFGGAGPILDFHINFKAPEERNFQEWIEKLNPPHYQLYTGPYSDNVNRPVCSFIDKKYQDLLKDFYAGKISSVGCGTKCNAVDIYKDKISFYRSWANKECVESDKKILHEILSKVQDINEWAIYDEWYGYWVKSRGRESLAQYLEI